MNTTSIFRDGNRGGTAERILANGGWRNMNKNPQAGAAIGATDPRFQALFDATADFIFVIDPQGAIQLANHYASAQSGYRPNELVGRHIREFFTQDSKALCDCNLPELLRSGRARSEVEFVCKDGRVLQMDCQATAVPDGSGEFSSFLVIQRDISDSKHIAAELANSERRFRAIFNSTFQFIGMLSTEGILLEANKAALDSIGVTEKEVVGKYFWDTPWWNSLDEEREHLKAAVARAARGELVRFETRHLDRDGNVLHVDFSLKPVKNETGDTILLIPEGRDITERRAAEEITRRHLREQAHLMRLSTMGEMAAGIAHELNQPLTALISYCGTAHSRLQEMPSVPHGLADLLSRANQQAYRASGIIAHIRNFVSKGETRKQPVEIDAIILHMSEILDWELYKREGEITFDLDGRGRQVLANNVQIEQVLLNLIRNSIEAIHNASTHHGQVIVRTRVADDRTIEITVQDNGPGIEPKMRERLFEAFQTSKQGGMGMGLSISRSIIQEHRGRIRLDDTGPHGTTFSITLPLIEQDHE